MKKKKGIDLDINKKNWEYKTSINFKKKLEKKRKKIKGPIVRLSLKTYKIP
jgi:hypothetical protein